MKILRIGKKLLWGISTAAITISAEITAMLQMVRNFLLLVLELPALALRGALAFFCFAMLISGYLSRGSVLENIFQGLLLVLAAYLIYKIILFVFALGTSLLAALFALLDFDAAISVQMSWLQKCIYEYMDCFDPDGPKKSDRLLFVVPFLIHWFNKIARWLSDVLRFAVYPASGMYGAYWGYTFFFASSGVAPHTLREYIVVFLSVAMIGGIFIHLGHAAVQALRLAISSIQRLDDLLAAYGEFVGNIAADTAKHNNQTNNGGRQGQQRSSTDGSQHTAFATAEENPYITILGTARTKEDLQKLYRSYMKKLHPDVCKEYSLEESTHRTILLNDAYDYWKRQYQYC